MLNPEVYHFIQSNLRNSCMQSVLLGHTLHGHILHYQNENIDGSQRRRRIVLLDAGDFKYHMTSKAQHQ